MSPTNVGSPLYIYTHTKHTNKRVELLYKYIRKL
jgi:hypothetical protein